MPIKVGDRVYFQWHYMPSEIDGMGTVVEVRDSSSFYPFKILLDDTGEEMHARPNEVRKAGSA